MSLTIQGIVFTPAPISNISGTLSYKLSSSPTFIGETVIIIKPDGSFVTPITYNSLIAGQTYTFKVQLNCGTVFTKDYTVPAVIPTINISGTIIETAHGIIVDIGQAVPCANISLFIQGKYDLDGTLTNFGANVNIIPGNTHGSNLTAIPIGGVISCISSNYGDGLHYYHTITCGGNKYVLLLTINSPC